jgi:hypothetical protein
LSTDSSSTDSSSTGNLSTNNLSTNNLSTDNLSTDLLVLLAKLITLLPNLKLIRSTFCCYLNITKLFIVLVAKIWRKNYVDEMSVDELTWHRKTCQRIRIHFLEQKNVLFRFF